SSTESIDLGGADLDYDLKTYGIYGTYNYVFPNTSVYAKGKIGFAKAEVDTEINELNFSESGSDSGVAGGIAIGYNVNPNIAVEGEWAYIAEDVTALTIGAKYKF
ncbi:MAG: outer membrane beta-barrel protein, partial [Psychrobacter sp.]|nr:outer membrane beta-barrel protein [Psychrobacter sp.]